MKGYQLCIVWNTSSKSNQLRPILVSVQSHNIWRGLLLLTEISLSATEFNELLSS